MSAVCIIPARGGSRRIPRKNIRMFHGKPIISYSIETAQKSGLFDEIWVSSEDDEIGGIAEQFSAKWHKRFHMLADDRVGTQAVMANALSELYQESMPQYACCIYATAPLMDIYDLQSGFKILEDDNEAAFAFSVGINPTRDAGQWYWGRSQAFLDFIPLDWNEQNVWKVAIPDECVCDINTEEDWQKAEQMYAALKEKA